MIVSRSSELEFVPASHEDPNDPGVLKKVLLAKNDLTAGQVQMVNWSLLKVGKQFCPHYHQDMQEVFMLVSGIAEMQIWPPTCVLDSNRSSDSQAPPTPPTVIELKAGDTVLVEPNEVHAMKNISNEDVQYIVFGVSTGQGGQTINVDWEVR